MLREVGLSRPATPTQAIARLLWERARTTGQLRHQADPDEPSASELEVLELLWAVAPSLAFVDLLGGSALQSRYARMALRSGDIDFILGALRPTAEAKDLQQEALFDDRISVIARADHPLAKARRIDERLGGKRMTRGCFSLLPRFATLSP